MVIDNWPLYFLSQRPVLILSIAIIVTVYAVLCRGFARSRRTFVCSALVWLAYSAWETRMLLWRSPTGDMAMRVDALFIEPVMQVLLLANVLLILWCSFEFRRRRDVG